MCFSSFFLTLTYAPEHVPISQNGFKTVWKPDVQNFFKRLRYYMKEDLEATGLTFAKVKYYAAAEYGEHTYRPHYHIIIFNAHEKHILAAWRLGNVHFGQVTGASVAYSLKYISKAGLVGKFDRDDRVKEFSLMSKGLGKSWVTPQKVAWYQADPVNRQYAMSDFGTKIPIPRYYKPHVLNHKQIEQAVLQAKNKEFEDWQRLTDEKRARLLNEPYSKQKSHERRNYRDASPASLDAVQLQVPQEPSSRRVATIANSSRRDVDHEADARQAYTRTIDSILAKRAFVRARRGLIWYQYEKVGPGRRTGVTYGK